MVPPVVPPFRRGGRAVIDILVKIVIMLVVIGVLVFLEYAGDP